AAGAHRGRRQASRQQCLSAGQGLYAGGCLLVQRDQLVETPQARSLRLPERLRSPEPRRGAAGSQGWDEGGRADQVRIGAQAIGLAAAGARVRPGRFYVLRSTTTPRMIRPM